MVEFKSFQMFLILMIPFTAVTQHRSFITVRVGDEATLPCEDVKDYQDKCHSTTWFFNYLITGPSETLFEYGKIHREAASKSHRLNVTEKCSLVIKKVTDEDVGLYTCRQFDESGKLVKYSDADLTLTYTAVTQHYSRISVRVGDEAALPCEDVKDLRDKCFSTWVFNYLTTGSTVILYQFGQIHRQAAAKSYRLSVTEKCSLVIKKVTDEDVGRYTCRQFDESGKQATYYDIDLSVDKRDNVATAPPRTAKLPTTTTKRTTKANKATIKPTTTTTPTAAETSLNAGCWIRFIFVLVGVAALSMIVVSVNIWTRTKGSKTHRGKKQHSDEDDDVVTYENAEDVSAPVRFHRSTNQL